MVGRLFGSAELLLSFPLMGRLGQVTGTFEWVVPRLPYVLVYEVDEDEQRVIVIAVLHWRTGPRTLNLSPPRAPHPPVLNPSKSRRNRLDRAANLPIRGPVHERSHARSVCRHPGSAL
ncbi:type II toxin-antitoxin system RelE/ParE family toxin [Rhodopseudomonas palustris]